MKNNFLPWSSITREERFFCSHLYHSILSREGIFIKWLNEKTKLNLNENASWEISYEVCFYRDFLKSKDNSVKTYKRSNGDLYSQKRTFDLCLFSKDEFVIIEAKVQQGFSLKQIKEIDQDEELVKELLKNFNHSIKKVKTVLLYSYQYSPKEPEIKKFPKITWKDLHNSPFQDKNVFELADEKFRR